jgi:hypothetical protein
MVEDFERAVLGAILLNNAHWPEVAVLGPDDFLLDSHRRIYARMVDLVASSRQIDTLTLVDELERRGDLQAVGDVGYVSGLVDALPDRPIGSMNPYVNEVRKCAGLRCIVRAADSIRERAANDPAATIAGLRSRFLEAERGAGRYEAEYGTLITRIEDIPDPFACSSDETGWVVHGLIPERGITIIAGEAGAGKTWLALALARAMTLGRDLLDRRTSAAQVLYLDRENPLSLIRDRLQVLFGGTSDLRLWGLWCPDEPPMIGDPRLLEFAKDGPLIIFDSMIRFHRADENSATEMAQVMARLRQLATVGASVVVLHHKAKSDTSSYRGSSDIVAGADAVFALAKRDDLLELRTFKNRFAAETTIKIRPDFKSGSFAVVGSPGPESAPDEIDSLAKIIRTSPGCTQNDIIKKCGIQRKRAIELLHSHDGKQWHRQQGANRYLRYFPIQVVPKGILAGSNWNHCANGSESSFPPDTTRREPLGITQVVPVPPPFKGGNRELLEYYGT